MSNSTKPGRLEREEMFLRNAEAAIDALLRGDDVSALRFPELDSGTASSLKGIVEVAQDAVREFGPAGLLARPQAESGLEDLSEEIFERSDSANLDPFHTWEVARGLMVKIYRLKKESS